MRFLIASLLAALCTAQTVQPKLCFGIPAGVQYNNIKNVVSASVVGTNLAKTIQAANNSDVNNALFPAGYSWLSTKGVSITGVVFDPTNQDYFNGKQLNASYAQVFDYSPMPDNRCNTTRKYDYTGALSAALNGVNSTAFPNQVCASGDLDLIEHLTAMIGTYSNCSDFNQTRSGGLFPPAKTGEYLYDINYLRNTDNGYVTGNAFGSETDVLAINAQFHRAMNFSVLTLDYFNYQVKLALQAHKVSDIDISPLILLLKQKFYVGQYSFISSSNLDCGANWQYKTNVTFMGQSNYTGCVPSSASIASALVACVAAVFALLF